MAKPEIRKDQTGQLSTCDTGQVIDLSVSHFLMCKIGIIMKPALKI